MFITVLGWRSDRLFLYAEEAIIWWITNGGRTIRVKDQEVTTARDIAMVNEFIGAFTRYRYPKMATRECGANILVNDHRYIPVIALPEVTGWRNFMDEIEKFIKEWRND